jgi:hypothetical protein
MPIRRFSLTRAERGRYRSDAQQLCAIGLDIDIPEELREDSRVLEIHIAPPYINVIRQLPSGPVAYAIWVRLVALRPNVILEDSQLASAWDQDLFQISANKKGLYCLRQGFNFIRAEVLNHFIEDRHCFHHRGDSVEGWLLATGLEPIPEIYPDHMSAGVDVSFTDQFLVDHVSPAYAFVERSAPYKAPTRRTEKFSGLYAPSTSGVSTSIGENRVSTPLAGPKIRFPLEHPPNVGVGSKPRSRILG